MRIFYRLTAFLIISFSALTILGAFDSAGQVEFNIRFFDRRIYYAESDPIYVQVTITNNSPAPYRFKLADDRAFSIDFDIRTMTNRQLPQADALVRKRNQNIHVFFREVSIESGESFSFVEDLREYVGFGQPGSFRVCARIYPELYRSLVVPAIETNYLNLSLRPELIRDFDGIPVETDVSTGAALVKQRIPPDEVVSYMITARQQSQWEKFFLYLDPEAMLQRDPFQKRKYQAENEAGRRNMILEYRQNLQSALVDGDIVVIPTSFEILRTIYNNDEGTVVVLQRYRMPRYTELREYTYTLVKRDNFWIIVNYSTQARGTAGND
ncbi:MAG: hypothetical protein FWC22_05255 [Treponema sp.]|nr:hypothetical protein [Treponema sp.]